jgi:hypothetical protein
VPVEFGELRMASTANLVVPAATSSARSMTSGAGRHRS